MCIYVCLFLFVSVDFISMRFILTQFAFFISHRTFFHVFRPLFIWFSPLRGFPFPFFFPVLGVFCDIFHRINLFHCRIQFWLTIMKKWDLFPLWSAWSFKRFLHRLDMAAWFYFQWHWKYSIIYIIFNTWSFVVGLVWSNATFFPPYK